MNKKTLTPLATGTVALLLLAACGGPEGSDPSEAPASSGVDAGPSAAETSGSSDHDDVEGTIVRFTTGPDSIDVTIDEDTPATRDFVDMLPMNISWEDFKNR